MALPKVPNTDGRCRVDGVFRSRAMRIGVAAIAVLCAPMLVTVAYGQGLSPGDVLKRLAAEDISETLLNLVSFTNDPGVGGATFKVKADGGQTDITYSKVNIRIDKDFWLPDRNLAIYGDINFSFLNVDDEFFRENALGERVFFNGDRNFYSGRIGLGVSHMITDHIRIRPFVSAALTRIESKTDVSGNINIAQLPPALATALLDWSTNAWTVAGTLNAKYDRFWGEEEERFEVEFDYTYAYHESFNEDLDRVSFAGTTDTLNLLVRYSEPTGAKVFGLPLRWNALVETSIFPTVDKDDTGFKFYFTFGGGLDLQIDWKPFGIDAYRYLGLRVSGLVGDDLTGFGVSISLRN
ncbi:MAG: hypothetical protein ACE5NA_08255 [Nitrospiraceae bacterium]